MSRGPGQPSHLWNDERRARHSKAMERAWAKKARRTEVNPQSIGEDEFYESLGAIFNHRVGTYLAMSRDEFVALAIAAGIEPKLAPVVHARLHVEYGR